MSPAAAALWRQHCQQHSASEAAASAPYLISIEHQRHPLRHQRSSMRSTCTSIPVPALSDKQLSAAGSFSVIDRATCICSSSGSFYLAPAGQSSASATASDVRSRDSYQLQRRATCDFQQAAATGARMPASKPDDDQGRNDTTTSTTTTTLQSATAATTTTSTTITTTVVTTKRCNARRQPQPRCCEARRPPRCRELSATALRSQRGSNTRHEETHRPEFGSQSKAASISALTKITKDEAKDQQPGRAQGAATRKRPPRAMMSASWATRNVKRRWG